MFSFATNRQNAEQKTIDIGNAAHRTPFHTGRSGRRHAASAWLIGSSGILIARDHARRIPPKIRRRKKYCYTPTRAGEPKTPAPRARGAPDNHKISCRLSKFNDCGDGKQSSIGGLSSSKAQLNLICRCGDPFDNSQM